MVRVPISWLSPAGSAGRLTILIFHRVLTEPDPLNPDEPDAAAFEQRLRWVRDWFTVLPLHEAAQRLADGSIPARALAITFDDGYADNREVAAPILHRLGLSATFFIATGFLGGGCMWNDRIIEAIRRCPSPTIDLRSLGLGTLSTADWPSRRQAVVSILRAVKHLPPAERLAATDTVAAAADAGTPPPLMMSVDQLRELRSIGMHIGAHTISHPILARSTRDEAWREIADGKRELEQMLGEPVTVFAYPNGVPGDDYAVEHVRMVRDAGFESAVSTAWGAASRHSDRFQLPRFTPWDRSRWRFGARLVANLGRPAPGLA